MIHKEFVYSVLTRGGPLWGEGAPEARKGRHDSD